MSFFESVVFSPTPKFGVDRAYLEGVQRGFGGSGVGLSLEDILVLLAILVTLVFLVLILRRWLKPAEMRLGPPDIDKITDPEKIRLIMERAVTRRATMDVDVLDPNFKEIYRGQLIRINDLDQLEVEIGSFTGADLDFRNKPARVSFRMSRRGEQEFFEFNAGIADYGFTRFRDKKEKALRINMPAQVNISQKRKFIRVQPRGHYALDAVLIRAPGTEGVFPVGNLRRLHQVEIEDLSIGGAQVKLTVDPAEMKIKPGQNLIVTFKAPVSDLDLDQDLDGRFLFSAKVISVDRMIDEPTPNVPAADGAAQGPFTIKLAFTGRGVLNRKEKTVDLRLADPVSFTDLGYWIQAYQRRVLQRERGVERRPPKVKNIYDRKPPKVTPKYPSHPLRPEKKD